MFKSVTRTLPHCGNVPQVNGGLSIQYCGLRCTTSVLSQPRVVNPASSAESVAGSAKLSTSGPLGGSTVLSVESVHASNTPTLSAASAAHCAMRALVRRLILDLAATP